MIYEFKSPAYSPIHCRRGISTIKPSFCHGRKAQLSPSDLLLFGHTSLKSHILLSHEFEYPLTFSLNASRLSVHRSYPSFLQTEPINPISPLKFAPIRDKPTHKPPNPLSLPLERPPRHRPHQPSSSFLQCQQHQQRTSKFVKGRKGAARYGAPYISVPTFFQTNLKRTTTLPSPTCFSVTTSVLKSRTSMMEARGRGQREGKSAFQYQRKRISTA